MPSGQTRASYDREQKFGLLLQFWGRAAVLPQAQVKSLD